MSTPPRLDLPARHRGHTPRVEAVALAGSAALWLAGILAIVMVAADWRPALLIAVVVLLLILGAAAVLLARVQAAGRVVDAAISRVLAR